MTKSIIKGVEKGEFSLGTLLMEADVRAIIAKGWSSRGGIRSKEGDQIEMPASCYVWTRFLTDGSSPRVRREVDSANEQYKRLCTTVVRGPLERACEPAYRHSSNLGLVISSSGR